MSSDSESEKKTDIVLLQSQKNGGKGGNKNRRRILMRIDIERRRRAGFFSSPSSPSSSAAEFDEGNEDNPSGSSRLRSKLQLRDKDDARSTSNRDEVSSNPKDTCPCVTIYSCPLIQ